MNLIIISVLAMTPWLTLIEGANSTHYTAAVVEYYPYVGNVTANAINFIKFIEDAARNVADIIVFPEAGLNGRGPAQPDTLTTVPDPALNITPCGSDDPSYNNALKMISCSARKNNVYVVINLAEYSEEAPNVTLKYNTNVVFNREGAVIARYRKANLYIEPGTTPFKSVPTYFDTDFGVRFGTFICFDVLFGNPPLNLTKQLGIKHIVFTTAWFAELPFYAANQQFQAWSYEQDVAMLVAGYNVPENGTSGSGIFLGRAGPIYSKVHDTATSEMYVASVPYSWDATNGQDLADADVNIITQEIPQAHEVPEGSLIKLMRQDMLVFESVLIKDKIFNKNLCYEEFCCNFVAIADGKMGDDEYSYRAVVFNGVIDLMKARTAGLQACAIVSCENQSISSCGGRINSKRAFTVLSVSGNFSDDNSHITANTLREDEGLTPLLPSIINFEKVCNNGICSTKLHSTKPVNNLLTFGISNRLYSRDGQDVTPQRSHGKNAAPTFEITLLCTALVSCLFYANLSQ